MNKYQGRRSDGAACSRHANKGLDGVVMSSKKLYPSAYDGGWDCVRETVGNQIVAKIACGSSEDARRIAACWNACDGLSTDGIEIGLPDSDGSIKNVERLEALVAENSEWAEHGPKLLAALIAARDDLEWYEEKLTGETYNSPSLNEAIRAAEVIGDEE